MKKKYLLFLSAISFGLFASCSKAEIDKSTTTSSLISSDISTTTENVTTTSSATITENVTTTSSETITANTTTTSSTMTTTTTSITSSATTSSSNITSFVVTIDYDNGSANEKVSVNVGAKLSPIETPIKEGYKFLGWYVNDVKYDFNSEVTSSFTLTAKWISVFTISFYDGDTLLDTVDVEFGANTAAYEALEKAGYVFNGWYELNSDEKFEFGSTLDRNINLYAKYDLVEESNSYDYESYNEGFAMMFLDADASSASAYYKLSSESEWIQADNELIRQVDNNICRVDFVGIKAGTYDFKVVSSSSKYYLVNEQVIACDDRSGYAHFKNTTGVGAYNNDGTLKSNAIVIYLTDSNKNTVEATIGSKKYTGLVNIINAYVSLDAKKQTGLDIRVIGKVSSSQWNYIHYDKNPYILYKGLPTLNSDGTLNTSVVRNQAYSTTKDIINANINSMSNDIANGITPINGLTNKILISSSSGVQSGFDSYFNMCDIKYGNNITIEGIGDDATIFQWGFEFVKCNSVEVKNLTFDSYTEDAVGFEGDKNNISAYGNYWVHNTTFNVGVNNWDVCDDQDKADGDGSSDIKYCHDVTISYTKYVHTHKTNLIGANQDSLQYNITLHHNFYDGCSQRTPLVRQSNVHAYNNYYYKISYSGSSVRSNAYLFAENNYYEECQNPIEIRNDKTDAKYAGNAFKAFNNVFVKCTISNKSATGYTNNNVLTREEGVTNNCKADGTTDYSSFDTSSTLFYYDSTNKVSDVLNLLSPENAKQVCMKKSGAMKNELLVSGSVETVTVMFETNGGSSIDSKKVEKGASLASLPTPTKSGYKFDGWYFEQTFDTLVTTSTVINENVTLYAKYIENLGPTLVVNADTIDLSTPISTDEFDLNVTGFSVLNNYSSATTEDNKYTFTKAIVAGGSSGAIVLSAKQSATIVIYYSATDSSFTTKDQSKSGNLTINGTAVETIGNKSNKVAYAYTLEIEEGVSYTIKTSSNRIVLFGIEL